MYASGQVAHIQVEPAVTAAPLLRVLVIDDDESVGAAIKVFLARRRCRTELASGAYAGIQALAHSSFDVVLVDLFMTGMSGLDAIAYIRQRSAVPIVAMSGFRLRSSLEPVDYLRTALQRGASRYLRKPFSSHELIEAIDLSLPLHAHSGVLLR
ncbi:response regulator [Bradyrhizobium sp. HKCCYLR20261]|uniref:response regulator n=1 Tax=Bradyrhizobium sp. HKCCYLR20261 TaxID=3420760 RepID=UPI003EBBA434